MRNYFIETNRIVFSMWTQDDLPLARLLWGERKVTEYICASGVFSDSDICNRLNIEIRNGKEHQVQYWPIFEKCDEDLIGCCGLRPFQSGQDAYEIGFHLREKYWGQGLATEAAKTVIEYAFTTLNAMKIFAGHHPHNNASKKILTRLGFCYIGDNLYKPTGLYHPSYEMVNPVD